MYQLNLNRLAVLVRNKRGSKGLRTAAKEIGNVSTSTLSRVENSKMPDMETFLALCNWLKIPPASLFSNDEAEADVHDSKLNTGEDLAIQIMSDKSLDPAAAKVLAELIMTTYSKFRKL